MSWLFGKKKHHKESPTDSTEEDQTTITQTDDMVIVERKGYPPFNNPTEGGTMYPSSGLFPSLIAGVPTYPTLPSNFSKQGQQAEAPHYLSGVPFKLSRMLEANMNNDFEIDRLRANEILSFIERIEQYNDNYDFSLEQDVITEMNSTNNE